MNAPTYSAADLKHRTAHYAEMAAQAEVVRKAACFDELLAALIAVLLCGTPANGFTITQEALAQASAAIRKARP